MIFSCTWWSGWGGDETKRVSCYAAWSSVALDGQGGVGWGGDNTKRVSCYATWSVGWGGDETKRVSCYAAWSSVALDGQGGVGWGGVGIIPNVSGATIHDLQLHLMVRVGWGGVGIIPNMSRARLHDLQLHLMVRVGWGGVDVNVHATYTLVTCTSAAYTDMPCYCPWPLTHQLDWTLSCVSKHVTGYTVGWGLWSNTTGQRHLCTQSTRQIKYRVNNGLLQPHGEQCVIWPPQVLVEMQEKTKRRSIKFM